MSVELNKIRRLVVDGIRLHEHVIISHPQNNSTETLTFVAFERGYIMGLRSALREIDAATKKKKMVSPFKVQKKTPKRVKRKMRGGK